MRGGGAAAGWVALAICLGPRAAGAHTAQLVLAHLAIAADRSVAAELALKGADLDRLAGTHLVDAASGLVRADALAAASDAIARLVLAETTLAITARDGSARPCVAGAVTIAADQDGVVARWRWTCPALAGAARYRYRSALLFDRDAAMRQAVLAESAQMKGQALLDASMSEMTFPLPAAPALALLQLAWRLGAGALALGTLGLVLLRIRRRG